MAKKILIVDDSGMTHSIYKAFLSSYGDIEAVHCNNGQEAWDAIVREDDVKLVLLDLQMPVMDGFQFLEQKNKHYGLRGIPVVVISWNDKQEDVDRAMKLGAYGFINKSELSELDEVITTIFG